MTYRLLADLVLLTHLAFVAFTLFGGLLAWRRPSLAWIHLPALLWGVIVQWANLVCPLTPLENRLRILGGDAGYSGGFIEHYVVGLLYPDSLPMELRYALGALLLALNLAIYARVILRPRA